MTSTRTMAAMMAVFLLAVSAAVGGEAHGAHQIDLTTPNGRIYSGEPLVLDVLLHNLSSEPQPYTPLSCLTSSGGQPLLYVQRPGEQSFRRYRAGTYVSIVYGAQQWLEPRDGRSIQSVLCVEALEEPRPYEGSVDAIPESILNKLILTGEPGVYRFKVQYMVLDPGDQGDRLPIESEPLEVQVVDAEGHMGEARSRWMEAMKLTGGLFFSHGFPASTEYAPRQRQILEDLLGPFRDTVYGRYAQYITALNQNTFEMAGYAPEGWREYRRQTLHAFAYDPNFPLADDALFHLAQTIMSDGDHYGIGDIEEARRLVREQTALMDEYIERAPYSIEAVKRRPSLR